jgi:chain length determinant protein (polysaccharide antigen chain regulator)
VNDSINSTHDDEIDLVELIVNLWREKVIIILSTVVIAGLGGLYAYTESPIYVVSAQLLLPKESELRAYNKTSIFEVDPKLAFTNFVTTLESNDHLFAIAKKSSLFNESKDPISALKKMRVIQYPNTLNKNNEISPDTYTLSYEGKNTEELISLLNFELRLAKTKTVQDIFEQYISKLKKKIESIENTNEAAERTLDTDLKYRKSYILQARENEIAKLEESLKLANQLNIKEPTSLSKLAGINSVIDYGSSNSGQRNSSNLNITGKIDSLSQYNSHLSNKDYLRGGRILSAEIESLQRIKDNVFLDETIIILNNKKNILKSNSVLEELTFLLGEARISEKVTFYSENFYAPTSSIEPKKKLIILISILLGGMLGFFIAIGRIMVRNYGSKT